MKKGVLFLLSMALITGLQAQSLFELGVKTGLNLSIQTTKGAATNVDSEFKPGLHIGAYGNFFILEKVAAQLELLYSQKGSKWSDPYFSGQDNLSYLDIPLLIRYQPIDLVNVYAGPQFSFLTGARQIPDDGEAVDASEYYKGNDFGLVVGAELNLPMKLSISIRYVEGFSVTTESTYYIDQWKNRVFQVSLSYPILSE